MERVDVSALLIDLGVGLVLLDEGRVEWANEKALEILGVPLETLVGAPVGDPRFDFVDVTGRALGPDESPAGRAAEAPVHNQIVGIRRQDTGERIWVRVTARTQEGPSPRIVITFEDVSDDVLMRRDLHEREALRDLLRDVIDNLPQVVAVYERDGTPLLLNKALRNLMFSRGETTLGQDAVRRNLVEQDGSPRRRPNTGEHTRLTGETVHGEIVGLPSGGDEGTLWLSLESLTLGEGPPFRTVVTGVDVTESVRSRAQAADARKRLEDLVNAVPGVIYQVRTDRQGTEVMFMAGAIQEVLGKSREELQSDPDGPEVHPHDEARVGGAFQRAAADPGQAVEVDYRAKTNGSGWRWLRQRFVASPDGPDATVYTGLVLDVTEQHSLQEHLRRSERLDGMAHLAAGVAHNFNNSLAVMLPNLDSLLDRAPAELRPELQECREAAAAAATLVRRLVQAARGEPVQVDRSVDARVAIEHVVAICRGAFGPGITLDVVLPDEPVPLRATPDLLHQIVLNLAINARDATREHIEAPHICIALAADPDQGEAIIEVSDNGVGMPPEVVSRLGEPFFTTKGPNHGTGLGLATIYGIVAELHGAVEVRSEPDQGTTFQVRLPLVDDPSLLGERSVPPSDDTPVGRVLLVDDQDLVRSALARSLRQMGQEVLEAHDGEEGLALADDAVDLVLLDLSMPGMSGREVLVRLKERLPHVPVAILTGHVEVPPAELAAADAVVRKPVGRDGLIQLVDKHLRRR